MTTKQNLFTFEIKKLRLERTNVLGSDLELKKFEYSEENDNPYRKCPVFEYEAKFKLFDIRDFKRAIDIIRKLDKEAKIRLILEDEGLIKVEYKGVVSNFDTKLIGKGNYKEEVLVSSEYLKSLLDSLDLKEIEEIDMYIKECYPLGLEILSDILPRLKSGASSELSHIVPNSTTTASKSEISKSYTISKGVNSGSSNPIKKMKKNKYLNIAVRSHPPNKLGGFPAHNDKNGGKNKIILAPCVEA